MSVIIHKSTEGIFLSDYFGRNKITEKWSTMSLWGALWNMNKKIVDKLLNKERIWNGSGKYVESQWGTFKDCCLENIEKENETREKKQIEKGIRILKKVYHKEITFGYLTQNSLKQKRRDRLGAQ